MWRRWLVGGAVGLVIILGVGFYRMLYPYSPPDMSLLEAQVRVWCAQKGVEYPLRRPRVLIDKSARRLELYEGDRLLSVFPIALSSRPEGDKEREGDRKVPEGRFFICEKHYSPRFYLFLGLSYPAVDDAERGKRTGLIDEGQYRAIRQAHARGLCPPWRTQLGGAIGIHGGGTRRDWTLGCIALNDADVERLYLLLPIGTPVHIVP